MKMTRREAGLILGKVNRGNSDHRVIPITAVYHRSVPLYIFRSLYAVEGVLLLSYVAYITERLTSLPLRDNLSERK